MYRLYLYVNTLLAEFWHWVC